MLFHEMQSPEDARAYVLQGLRWMRAVTWQPAMVRLSLDWIRQLASEGHAIPPPGFVADIGVVVARLENRLRPAASEISDWPGELVRGYEDHVLSKLYSDRGIDRAGDALCRIAERDRVRGMAFIVDSIRDRLGLGGVTFGPASLKPLLEMSPEAVIAAEWQSEATDGVKHVLMSQYRELIAAVRLSADLLGPEDVFELERGTAVAELGQRVALRQVLRAASLFEERLPKAPPMLPARKVAPTRMLDDDAYPVGGFAAISNRGSLESLLHSQLAYMETGAVAERPDLFDVKYLRDELLYYSRDENQFYRRRRYFVFEFAADLIAARTKDPELPYQRIVLTLATVVAAVRRLTEWLTDEALTFELRFPPGGALNTEAELLATVFRDRIDNGAVTIITPQRRTGKKSAADEKRASDARHVLMSVGGRPKKDQFVLRPSATPEMFWSSSPGFAGEELGVRLRDSAPGESKTLTPGPSPAKPGEGSSAPIEQWFDVVETLVLQLAE
jgi:vWA domain found in the FtsH ternary systems/N-terminal helical region fused to the FtsH ternary system vWA domain